jgi:hypothetical protein
LMNSMAGIKVLHVPYRGSALSVAEFAKFVVSESDKFKRVAIATDIKVITFAESPHTLSSPPAGGERSNCHRER